MGSRASRQVARATPRAPRGSVKPSRALDLRFAEKIEWLGPARAREPKVVYLQGLKVFPLQGVAVSDTPQGKVARVGVPDSLV